MAETKLRIGLVGASGRMGRRVAALLAEHPRAMLAASIERAVSPEAPDRAAALARVDVVVDFSAPPACSALLPLAVAHGRPYLVASTGLDASARQIIDAAARAVPVLVAENLSIGVNVLVGIVEQTARLLGPEFDAEIVELHHRHKRDAPSGTALVLAGAVERARGPLLRVTERAASVEGRKSAELGLVSVRGGDAAGEHTVYFLGAGERLELTHRAADASIFAQGALRAAAWLAGQQPGLYRMGDVIVGMMRGGV